MIFSAQLLSAVGPGVPTSQADNGRGPLCYPLLARCGDGAMAPGVGTTSEEKPKSPGTPKRALRRQEEVQSCFLNPCDVRAHLLLHISLLWLTACTTLTAKPNIPLSASGGFLLEKVTQQFTIILLEMASPASTRASAIWVNLLAL